MSLDVRQSTLLKNEFPTVLKTPPYDKWIDSQFTKTLRYGKRFAKILFTKTPQRIRKGGVSRFES